jgi:hypothetical protein
MQADFHDMEGMTQSRMHARDAGLRLLNRLTTGIALAAVGALGVLTAVSAYTIPGTTTAPSSAATSSSSASTITPSTTPITSSSGTPIVVSGGSR